MIPSTQVSVADVQSDERGHPLTTVLVELVKESPGSRLALEAIRGEVQQLVSLISQGVWSLQTRGALLPGVSEAMCSSFVELAQTHARNLALILEFAARGTHESS
jgi:hypothetical protein